MTSHTLGSNSIRQDLLVSLFTKKIASDQPNQTLIQKKGGYLGSTILRLVRTNTRPKTSPPSFNPRTSRNCERIGPCVRQNFPRPPPWLEQMWPFLPSREGRRPTTSNTALNCNSGSRQQTFVFPSRDWILLVTRFSVIIRCCGPIIMQLWTSRWAAGKTFQFLYHNLPFIVQWFHHLWTN